MKIKNPREKENVPQRRFELPTPALGEPAISLAHVKNPGECTGVPPAQATLFAAGSKISALEFFQLFRYVTGRWVSH